MTPDRFRSCLEALSWSGRGLAALLNVDERQVRRWAKGDYSIPEPTAAWLETLARFHEAHPAPMAPPPAANERAHMSKPAEMEKAVFTTMDDATSRVMVEATHNLLDRLRQVVPNWGDRSNGLRFIGPDGEEIEVTAIAGHQEAVQIVVRPRLA